LGFDGGLAAELLGLVCQPACAAQAIERPVASRRQDPRGRTIRDATGAPRFKRGDKSFLDRLLGEVEIAREANQAGEDAARFLAKGPLDDLARAGRVQLTGASACVSRAPDVSAYESGSSQIGRISIEPSVAAGIFAARSMASSRSCPSIR
jgi:hypothetical protein